MEWEWMEYLTGGRQLLKGSFEALSEKEGPRARASLCAARSLKSFHGS
jgi:hypothetical protein